MPISEALRLAIYISVGHLFWYLNSTDIVLLLFFAFSTGVKAAIVAASEFGLNKHNI